MEKPNLLVLVADKNMEFTLRGALPRIAALNEPKIDCTIIQHPERDSGVRVTGPDVLARGRSKYSHALLVLDYEGSGFHGTATELENDLDRRLADTWEDNRGKAIVIEPEVDVWMWGSDNALAVILGRPGDQGIRDWLRQRGSEFSEQDKPLRPKEALEALVEELRQPRSSSIYQKIAGRISLNRCTDPAYRRLHQRLEGWFPPR